MKVLRTASLGSSFASSYKKRVYFSHNMTKVTSQNEVKAFCENICATFNAREFFQYKLCNSLRDFRNIFFARQFLHLT